MEENSDAKDGKPSDQALHEKCFPCYEPAKASDYVYTHYASRLIRGHSLLEKECLV